MLCWGKVDGWGGHAKGWFFIKAKYSKNRPPQAQLHCSVVESECREWNVSSNVRGARRWRRRTCWNYSFWKKTWAELPQPAGGADLAGQHPHTTSWHHGNCLPSNGPEQCGDETPVLHRCLLESQLTRQKQTSGATHASKTRAKMKDFDSSEDTSEWKTAWILSIDPERLCIPPLIYQQQSTFSRYRKVILISECRHVDDKCAVPTHSTTHNY